MVSNMITITQAIIVEGKYDKIKLSGIVDTLIIDVNGFHIFKDKEKVNFIKTLATTRGIIIMTDSDSAGLIIRNKINEIAKNGKVYNAYIPEIFGKEKRKSTPSKEGKLGVEGIDVQIIIKSLEKCGIKASTEKIDGKKITRTELYNLGITGGDNSKKLRIALLKHLNLPSGLSTNNLLKTLEHSMSLEDLSAVVNKIKEEF